MKVKYLTTQGNSMAIIIDRQLLDVLGIDRNTPIKMTLENGRIVLDPDLRQKTTRKASHVK
ncbi:MAG TPA: hypothetical protein VIM11_16195 [Tepidisphaeraceae bacterium]|jgi:antitoxin component of MazEF toxin-antitoxin module